MALDLKAIGTRIGPLAKEYDWKDLALYALGVGAGFEELEYCYEQRLKAIPSWGIASIFDFLAQVALTSRANLAGILHGEHELVVHRTIPTSGALSTEGTITRMYDKGEGKGAVVVAQADTLHSSGEKVFTNTFTLFCRLDGGFGGENVPAEEFAVPAREPDFVEEARPSPDQPLLYRLSGDVFALHVDPDFARASGFERPIMHGLCTLGYATRALVKHLVPREPERVRRLKVRFTRPLYPGTPIKTLIWRVDEGRAVWRAVNAETGEVAIDRGAFEWMSRSEAAARDARRGIRFDGRVAIVTGAGGGLGRIYAIELAKRGAAVVVNDLGSSPDGSASSSSPADAVVREILDLGGKAVPSYHSVSSPDGGKAIVDAAISSFGRLDILINNAGILRDRSLLKLAPDDWNAVLDVHLSGAYNLTRPALALMRDQGFGRIVLTTSAAGLYGNFGQANYSAAKLGLVGFMNTLKLEARKHDITVNTVAPLAASRLTEGVFPADLQDRVSPEAVAPLVLYLCSEECKDSGLVLNAGGRVFNRAAIVTGRAVVLGEGDAPPTPEAVARSWERLQSLEGAVEYDDAMSFVMAALRTATEASSAAAAETAQGGGKVAEVFDRRMAEAFDKAAASGLDVTFQFNISGEGGGSWNVTVRDSALSIRKGQADKPTTTIEMAGGDFIDLLEGRLDAMAAFTLGRLKLGGDVMKSRLVMKLFKLGS